MTTCPRCGAPIAKPTARFCAKCGQPLAPAVSAAPAYPHTPPSLAPAAMPGTGVLLNTRYRLLKPLGKGGMAQVYEALDETLRRPCAVKQMVFASGAFSSIQDAIAAFRREVTILAALNHPNIVRIYDFFEHNQTPYLVMELVAGQTLSAMVGPGRPVLPEAQVVVYAQQLCDALHYLHAQQPPIIYRDLKPDNIMVDRSGTVKLIDFGIARTYDAAKQVNTATLGSIGYHSPEHANVGGQTEPRSDLYSLGATVHQLLTGHDPSRTVWMIPPVRTINPAVSQPLAELVDMCVRYKVSERPASAAVVKARLTALLPPAGPTTPAALVAPAALGIPLGGMAAQPMVGGGAQTPYALPQFGTPPVSVISAAPRKPTTKLVLLVAQLTLRQQLQILGAMLVLVVAGTLLLGPTLAEKMRWLWYGVPFYMIGGPAALTATRRTGVGLGVHALLALATWGAIRLRMGDGVHNLTGLGLGLLLSGIALEVSLHWLYQRTRGANPNQWVFAMLWHSATLVAMVILFYAPWYPALFGETFVLWPGSMLVGAAAWFVGDLIREGWAQWRTRLP